MAKCYICDSIITDVEFEGEGYSIAPCPNCLSEIQEMVSERNIEDLFLRGQDAFRTKSNGD